MPLQKFTERLIVHVVHCMRRMRFIWRMVLV